MSAKNVVLLIVALGALGAAAAIFINRTGGPDPEGLGSSMPMLCLACGAEFDIDKGAVARDGPPRCPECGDLKTMTCAVCPECHRHLEFVGHGGNPASCKYCGATLDDSGFAENEAMRHKSVNDAIQKNGG
ncbi:MAG: hypothetical protein H6811_07730 [Phycisphaeraceae bacterium]|nr:hypothetical protein [Phycisphaeraceae bacterium]